MERTHGDVPSCVLDSQESLGSWSLEKTRGNAPTEKQTTDWRIVVISPDPPDVSASAGSDFTGSDPLKAQPELPAGRMGRVAVRGLNALVVDNVAGVVGINGCDKQLHLCATRVSSHARRGARKRMHNPSIYLPCIAKLEPRHIRPPLENPQNWRFIPFCPSSSISPWSHLV